ncbi:MAG: hypothetical protein QW767_05370 [Thermoprotei archaeon]
MRSRTPSTTVKPDLGLLQNILELCVSGSAKVSLNGTETMTLEADSKSFHVDIAPVTEILHPRMLGGSSMSSVITVFKVGRTLSKAGWKLTVTNNRRLVFEAGRGRWSPLGVQYANPVEVIKLLRRLSA